jgi:hypothetical protein
MMIVVVVVGQNVLPQVKMQAVVERLFKRGWCEGLSPV